MNVVELSISGNDKQKITEQNDNLLIFKNGEQEINGVTVSFENGVITLNGTAINMINLDIPIKDLLKADTYRFTISQISGSRSDNIGFLLRDSNTDENLITINGSSGTTYVLENNTYCYLRIYIPKNNQISNLVYKCMLSKGEEAKEWVEGIPNSPSPLYPSEVETVNTQANIIIEKENLLDKNNVNKLNGCIDNNGYFQYNQDSKILYLECKEDTNYTIYSKYLRALAFTNTIPKTGVTSNNFKIQNTEKLTLNSLKNTYLCVWYYSTSVENLTEQEILDSIKIQEGTNIEQQTKTVYIQQPMLFGDYFVKEEDGWKEVHGWNKQVLDGTESGWNISGTDTSGINRFSNNIISNLVKKVLSSSEVGLLICDKFIAISANQSYNKIEGICINSSETLYIFYNYCSSMTVEEFKNWLSQNNLTLYYKLETPLKLVCTKQQSAQLDDLLNTSTYKNVTHIYSTDKVSPVIKIKYRKDIETMLNNQQSEYETRLSNIEKLLTTTTTSAMLLDNLQSDLEKEVL